METSVIIPNWNGRHLLKMCLPSLQIQTFKNFEVIVVDNGSTDGSQEFIKNNYPKIKLIELDKNYGFARAVNIGIKKSNAEYLILINNDTEVDKNCLGYLVTAAKVRPEVGFVTAKMLQFYHRDKIDSAGDFIDTVGHANNIGFGQKDTANFNKSGYIFLVNAGGSLFKRVVFDKVGFFDEDYFAYMEDVDLCLRAQFRGFKGWYEPKAIIYHIHKATALKNPHFLEYLQFRNMTQTIIKDFPKTLLLKNFNWLKILLVNLNTVRFLGLHGFIWEAIRAEIYILFHLSRLLKKRRLIQKSIQVSEQYITQNIKYKKITFFGLVKS